MDAPPSNRKGVAFDLTVCCRETCMVNPMPARYICLVAAFQIMALLLFLQNLGEKFNEHGLAIGIETGRSRGH